MRRSSGKTVAGNAYPGLDTYGWETVRGELAGLPGGRGLNIAHEAVDRHANGPRRDDLALRWLGKDGAVHNFTCADLIGLHEALGVEIPEADYGQLTRLADIIRYISDRLR